MDIRRYGSEDLPGVLRLCEIEHWPSLPEDPARAHRALTAPGVVTMVAVEDGALAGFAQLQSDGEIQAHLSLIAVDPAHRRRGVARALIAAALREAGGLRIDLVTDSADGFYAALPHFRMAGFRIYPNYSGPDRDQPDVVWKDGRKVPAAKPRRAK
jgi:ribosomal protein S18 acetylase RimI-like enzyme